ncbi:MAG: hypothetical protein HY928_04220 [Elusimicrobia bacterium]|nr:hypothetical protein [Elusimicrobiota bacterium]
MKRGRRETVARLVLVAVNAGSILGLLAGFYASNRHKSCEEDRTRRVFFHQHDATTAVLNMLLTPKRRETRGGDYDDALYDQVERAARSRARFVQYLNDESCAGWDRSAQWGLCLSGVFQVLAGMTAVLLRLGD